MLPLIPTPLTAHLPNNTACGKIPISWLPMGSFCTVIHPSWGLWFCLSFKRLQSDTNAEYSPFPSWNSMASFRCNVGDNQRKLYPAIQGKAGKNTQLLSSLAEYASYPSSSLQRISVYSEAKNVKQSLPDDIPVSVCLALLSKLRDFCCCLLCKYYRKKFMEENWKRYDLFTLRKKATIH